MVNIKNKEETKEKTFQHYIAANKYKKGFLNPFYLLIIIIISIFLAETLVMYILSALPHLSNFQRAIIDASLLIYISFPMLYFFVLRPLRLNITNRIKAEEALWGSERLHRTLVETSSDCICKLDLEGNFLYMNPAGLKSYGISLKEIKGTHCTRFSKNEYNNFLLNESLKKATNGETVRFRYEGETGLGERWFESTLTPQKDNSGKVVTLLRISRDITELKKVEAALKRSEETYRLIFENSPLGVCLFDSKGVVIDCNKNLSEILGAPRGRIIGVKMLTTFKDKRQKTAIETALSGNTGYFEGDYVSVTGGKDSSIRTIYSPLISEDGSIIGGISITEDITNQKTMEKEKDRLICELQEALAKVKTLSGILPICSSCKKIRDDKGYWRQLETYIRDHSKAEFTHSLCPECANKYTEN
jgi:PAS domain S-box-containing protein